ncbi:hypothetical protein DXG01_008090 [Tephrocybe rancida]|nr:hypothetical protein DXG01_008090 [Tephrocybe rancida]
MRPETTVDIFVDQEKINFFRVTFLMERMCPLSFGLGKRFNETYFSEYADAINHITLNKGAYALIDPHNYMRYNDPSQQPITGSVIGNSSDPTAATTKQFGEFWAELARRFKSNPKVVFGINNEPHDMVNTTVHACFDALTLASSQPTELVLQNNQAAIDGIRGVGARQLILAPGNGFTGGHSFTQVTGSGDLPSSDFMNKLKDPLHNTAIDIHEASYMDYCESTLVTDECLNSISVNIDFSGSHDTCPQAGPSNLAAVTAWLKENNLKYAHFLTWPVKLLTSDRAMITEFGGGNNEGCFQAIDDMLNYMVANEEYIGWAIWAAGPLWGTNSPCCGATTGSLEPGLLNVNGEPNAFDTVWAQAIRPNIPKNLKRSGVSSLS